MNSISEQGSDFIQDLGDAVRKNLNRPGIAGGRLV